MLTLRNADVVLSIDPIRGGGITRLRWRGIDIFRPAVAGNPGPLGLSSFVLVPFSNRIENGRFCWQGRSVTLSPNWLGDAYPLHGLGWLSPWSQRLATPERLVLEHHHFGAGWPFPYRAEQNFQLLPEGFHHRLSLTNTGAAPMPAGLGFHPYFPRPGAKLAARFDGAWKTRPDGIPTTWAPLERMPTWFGEHTIDTVFTGRRGPLAIDWPNHRVTIDPSNGLDFTAIYCPSGADFFCVEPVSHITNALNRPEIALSGQQTLEPGACLTVSIDILVEH